MKRQYQLLAPAPAALVAEPVGSWAKLVALYGSADPRSLGALRIALGALVMVDVAQKLPEAFAHYSNSGWLSNHFALFRPMSDHLFSVYFAFGSPREVGLLMLVHLLVGWLLLLGYRTKLMQLLALLLTTSLNSRNLMLENGGSVVLNILLMWTAFLPLGQRFSLDSLRRSLRERRETSVEALNQRSDPPRPTAPVVSLAVTALLLQWAAIYLFNAWQKNGAPWQDGTAVHYFLQQDRLVTWFGAWLRGVLPLGAIQALTFGTLALEWLLPLLLLSPLRTRWTRLLAFGLALLLHASIDAVLQLGSFSGAMVAVFFAFVPPVAWSWLSERYHARRTPCVLHFDPDSGASLGLCRLLKRFDSLGLVTFRALDDDSPKKADRNLVVSVGGSKTVSGYEALLAVADALWCGRLPLRVLGALGARKRIERRLVKMATDPETLDAELGTDALPAQADWHAAPLSPALALVGRLRVSLREAGVAVMLLASGSQLLLENPVVPAALRPERRPAMFQALIAYPRVFQGWSMFAPTPPLEEGRLVIDGRTKDDRPFDPLTGRAPAFEAHPAGEPRMNLTWGNFHARIAEQRFQAYWPGVRDFLMRHHELTGRPEDALKSFDAYYVIQRFAAPGAKPAPPERSKLFGSGFMPEGPPATPSPVPKSKAPKPRPR